MSRKTFLTIAALIALTIGGLGAIAPDVLLSQVKMAVPNPAALVMCRTCGILLLFAGLLAWLVRGHADSPTLAAVLKANVVLQLMIIPIDPLAYLDGTFRTWVSFVPNTLVHLFLVSGFFLHWRQVQQRLAAQARV
jgi:hypothetical protein